MRCPLSAPSFCASGTRRSSRTRMAACHISLVHTKSVSPIVVCRSSVTAFALAFSAVQVSMVDRGLCCAHHSRTLSRASSHITAFFSSDSFSSWGFLLNRHLSFLTLAIVLLLMMKHLTLLHSKLITLAHFTSLEIFLMSMLALEPLTKFLLEKVVVVLNGKDSILLPILTQ